VRCSFWLDRRAVTLLVALHWRSGSGHDPREESRFAFRGFIFASRIVDRFFSPICFTVCVDVYVRDSNAVLLK
jgi:hypothetical protein